MFKIHLEITNELHQTEFYLKILKNIIRISSLSLEHPYTILTRIENSRNLDKNNNNNDKNSNNYNNNNDDNDNDYDNNTNLLAAINEIIETICFISFIVSSSINN